MPLGGFCPLPLRLGGDPAEGVSAEQWSRLTADLSAQTRTAIAVAPSGALQSVAHVTWSWNLNYENDYGEITPTQIRYAIATAHGATAAFARVSVTHTHQMKVITYDDAGAQFAARTTLVVW